tara:strand:+ start:2204 stop:2704 length:501 start_codon:yes stop_codon:yes gene_type:complete
MDFRNVKIYKPNVHTDYRGDLWTLWKKGVTEFNFDVEKYVIFNHDKVSTSRKNVLRGIHGDFKSFKLVTCLYGEIYFVLVDNRKDSETYMQWDSIVLDDKSRKQVLIPPGMGNGFCVLSDHSVFHYKWAYEGEYPDVDEQFTIKWNDKKLNINWPIDNPILQLRDK